MIDDLQRRWPGHGPWDEVWFLELSLPEGGSAWVRYTLADGPHRRGLATWAIATGPWGVLADQGQHRLSTLHPGVPLRNDDLLLTATDARGVAGDARWSLRLSPGPRRHRMVPRAVERLGVGRTYVPAGLDLTVDGTLHVGGRTFELAGQRAVLGHIWGASNRTRAWGWAHAHIPEGDVLVELLSVRLGPLPPLLSLGVWVGDEHLDLSRSRHLLRGRSRFGPDTLEVEQRSRGRTVRVRCRLPGPEAVATVAYVDPGDGTQRTCRNSGASLLELEIEQEGSIRRFRTATAAFELAHRGPATTPLVLSD